MLRDRCVSAVRRAHFRPVGRCQPSGAKNVSFPIVPGKLVRLRKDQALAPVLERIRFARGAVQTRKCRGGATGCARPKRIGYPLAACRIGVSARVADSEDSGMIYRGHLPRRAAAMAGVRDAPFLESANLRWCRIERTVESGPGPGLTVSAGAPDPAPGAGIEARPRTVF